MEKFEIDVAKSQQSWECVQLIRKENIPFFWSFGAILKVVVEVVVMALEVWRCRRSSSRVIFKFRIDCARAVFGKTIIRTPRDFNDLLLFSSSSSLILELCFTVGLPLWGISIFFRVQAHHGHQEEVREAEISVSGSTTHCQTYSAVHIQQSNSHAHSNTSHAREAKSKGTCKWRWR